MTTTEEAPAYEVFIAHPNTGRKLGGGPSSIIRGLEVGVPQRVPVGMGGQKPENTFGSVARSLGIKVAMRHINGELWVCRLKDEDAK